MKNRSLSVSEQPDQFFISSEKSEINKKIAEEQKEQAVIKENKRIAYETAAKETIFHGLRQLDKTLENILAKEGRMPAAIVYADTSTRPLRYAVKSLLEKFCLANGVQPPPEFFVKTSSYLRKKDSAQQSVVNERLAEIKKIVDSGPFLFIDEFTAGGVTFAQLARAADRLKELSSSYFFSFASSAALPIHLRGLVDTDHFSAGVCLPAKGINNKNIDRVLEDGYFQDTTKDFDELFFDGFPFRAKKEETTGVKKDEESSDLYVKISAKADPVAKRTEREKYAAWGREAVQKIFVEKKPNQ